MKKTDPPIVIEETFNATASQLWSALTEVNQMHQWYFSNLPDFQATVGFKTNFVVSNEGRTFTHLWTVTEVAVNQKITYTWQYKEWAGDSSTTFEILKEGNQHIVRVTATVLEDFPQDIPEFKRESAIGGWTYFIKESLKKHIESLA